jgi:hypothetical protein
MLIFAAQYAVERCNIFLYKVSEVLEILLYNHLDSILYRSLFYITLFLFGLTLHVLNIALYHV